MQKYQILIEPMPKLPEPHEIRAALLLSSHFKSNILFLRPNDYGTPDLKILNTNELWELKSPIGNSKKTIENNLRNARKQSKHIIIDLSRCKMPDNNAIARTKYYLKHGHRNINKLKIIKKNYKIIDIL